MRPKCQTTLSINKQQHPRSAFSSWAQGIISGCRVREAGLTASKPCHVCHVVIDWHINICAFVLLKQKIINDMNKITISVNKTLKNAFNYFQWYFVSQKSFDGNIILLIINKNVFFIRVRPESATENIIRYFHHSSSPAPRSTVSTTPAHLLPQEHGFHHSSPPAPTEARFPLLQLTCS